MVSVACLIAASCGEPPATHSPRDSYAEAVATIRRASAGEARFLAVALAQLLETPDPAGWMHRSTIEALGRAADPRAVPALGRIVEAPPELLDFFQRRLAARALGRLGTFEAAELLTRNLTRKERGLALEKDCRAGLVFLGSVARPALESALLAADPELIIAATATLAELGDAEALPALHAALVSEFSVGPVETALTEAISALDVRRTP